MPGRHRMESLPLFLFSGFITGCLRHRILGRSMFSFSSFLRGERRFSFLPSTRHNLALVCDISFEGWNSNLGTRTHSEYQGFQSPLHCAKFTPRILRHPLTGIVVVRPQRLLSNSEQDDHVGNSGILGKEGEPNKRRTFGNAALSCFISLRPPTPPLLGTLPVSRHMRPGPQTEREKKTVGQHARPPS